MSETRFLRIIVRVCMPACFIIAAARLSVDHRWDNTYIMGMAFFAIINLAAWRKA